MSSFLFSRRSPYINVVNETVKNVLEVEYRHGNIRKN